MGKTGAACTAGNRPSPQFPTASSGNLFISNGHPRLNRWPMQKEAGLEFKSVAPYRSGIRQVLGQLPDQAIDMWLSHDRQMAARDLMNNDAFPRDISPTERQVIAIFRGSSLRAKQQQSSRIWLGRITVANG